MEKTAKSILDSFSSNLFSGKMTLLLFLQIGFIVYERYLFLVNPRKWRDWEMFRFLNKTKSIDEEEGQKILNDLIKGIHAVDNSLRLKFVVKRLIIVRRLLGNIDGAKLGLKIDEMGNSKSKVEINSTVSDYIDNPMIKKFKYQASIMLFIYFMTFVMLPLIGNSKVTGKSFCNSIYKPAKSGSCNYTGENIYIWLFFVIYTCYFIVSAIQIRKGESFMKN